VEADDRAGPARLPVGAGPGLDAGHRAARQPRPRLRSRRPAPRRRGRVLRRQRPVVHRLAPGLRGPAGSDAQRLRRGSGPQWTAMARRRAAVSGRAPLRVLLVDTSPRHRPGSMRRYGDLVVAAVEAALPFAAGLELRRWDLGAPSAVSSAVPSRLEPWLRRAWASFDAIRRPTETADVVHVLDASSGLSVGLRLGAPVMATVHDLIPLLQLRGRLRGGRHPGPAARQLIERTARDLARASRLLVDSRRTAQDVVDLAGVDPSRVTTIPLPVPPAFLDGPRAASPDPRMVIHVGNGGFYKNRAGVLRVVSLIRRKVPVRLVLVGERLRPELQRLVDELQLRPYVEVRPATTDAELRAAYG